MDPNRCALLKTGEGEIYAKVDKSIVGKHKGDDGGTFRVEGGVQEATKTRMRCFLLTFSLQKRKGKTKIS
jgi:hypothetical protein